MSQLNDRLRGNQHAESGLTLIELLITITLMLVVVGVASDGLFNFSRASTAAELHTFSLAQNRVGMERMTDLIRQATYGPDKTDANRLQHPIVTNISANSITFTSRAGGTSAAAAPIERFVFTVTGNTLQMGRSTCLSITNGLCSWCGVVNGGACAQVNPVMQTLISNVQVGSNGPCKNKGADDHPFRYFQTNSPTAQLAEIKLKPDPDPAVNGTLPDKLWATNGTPAGSGNDDTTLSQIDTVQISLFTQETGAGMANTCESLTANVNIRNLTFS